MIWMFSIKTLRMEIPTQGLLANSKWIASNICIQIKISIRALKIFFNLQEKQNQRFQEDANKGNN